MIRETIQKTNKAWDNIAEPWRFLTAMGTIAVVAFLLPDIWFAVFVLIIVIWRLTGIGLGLKNE